MVSAIGYETTTPTDYDEYVRKGRKQYRKQRLFCVIRGLISSVINQGAKGRSSRSVSMNELRNSYSNDIPCNLLRTDIEFFMLA